MPWSIRLSFCLFVLLGWQQSGLVHCQEPARPEATSTPAPSIREYRSSRLHVRTDLPTDEAAMLYERLEETLLTASRYWGRKPRGQITCYVVHDLSAWTDDQLPHRLSRVIINGVGGATVPKIVGHGNQARNQPTVFASSKPGVAEHELVHAYCIQTFGSTGPEWYKEGMAEMAVNRSSRESGLQCSPAESEILRKGECNSLARIFAAGSAGQRIFASLRQMLEDPANRDQHVPPSRWTELDTANVLQARDEYLHSWAFCYMMLHNKNYSKRFHSLGNVLIAEQRDAFDEFFAAVRDRIEFEHRLFLQHAAVGYRVDLCSWDWDSPFRTLDAGQSRPARIAASLGFQASGVTVTAGQRYRYRADGRWSLAKNGPQVDADGDIQSRGQLVGILLDNHTLSQPIPLGTDGVMQPETSGRLYLRCRDAWNEIADNQGEIRVLITRE